MMSYQQFLRSTSNSQDRNTTPSPTSSAYRKPPVNYTTTLRNTSSFHSSVTQNTAPQSTRTPSINTPLSSFPPTKESSPSPSPASRTRVVENPEHGKVRESTALPQTPSTTLTTASTLKPLLQKEIDAALGACLDLQNTAVSQHDKRPFAALLLGPDNATVLNTHFSISHFQHAESELARLVSLHYSQTFLSQCTLVSTWEPCAMCAGTMYWVGIGRLLYAASESKLRDLTGDGNDENMTMSLPCRTVLHAGQRKTEIIGPVPEWEEKVVEESGKWWKEHQKPKEFDEKSVKETGSISGSQSIVTTYVNPDDSGFGTVGDDGEYQADLKVDWMS